MTLHSAEAEQYLIGALLEDNSLIDEVCSLVNPEDFQTTTCRDLMYLIMACHAKGMAADVVSLSNIRERLSDGDSTIAAAADILRNSTGKSNYRVFASVVRDRAILSAYKSALIAAVQEIEAGKDALGLIANTQNALSNIADKTNQPDVVRLSDAMPALIADIQERMDSGGKFKGLCTGYKDFDNLLRGAKGGHMIVVAGRPGTGKTTIAINAVENIAMHGVPALVFSLEMPTQELARRILASLGRVPLSAIDSGMIGDYNAGLTAGAQRIKGLPLFVCDRPGLNIAQIRAIARFQKRMNRIGVIVIDYITLINTTHRKGSTRSAEIGEISRQCKEMAKELDVPVIVLAQLNREIEKTDREPRLSDLRDSGEIEQDADVVVFLCKTEDDGMKKVVVAKHRHSKTGDCMMMFRGDISRFENAASGYVPNNMPRGREASDF